MVIKTKYYVRFALLNAALMGCIFLAGLGFVSFGQNVPAAPGTKTAEQQFKNIQVLKGVPADQVVPTMQFISGSLGVECEFCHVEGAFEKDDKKPKLAARKMITMMVAINKDNFEGHREVTCNSCHRGSPHPASIPAVASAETMPAVEHGKAEHEHDDQDADSGQSADPILQKYLAAVGGADAIKKVSSRVETGTASIGERQMPIEIFTQAPDRRASYLHLPGGDSITAYDGSKGWLGNPGRSPRPMGPAETEAARMDADLYFPAHLKEIFSSFKVGQPEKIAGQDVELVRALREGKPPVKLYFDRQSGFLLRMVRYADTALGLLPTQIDYADYRDSGGVKIPFRWTIARPLGSFTIQVDHADPNVQIDALKFAPPPAKPGS
jgi:photosynthetic reaction center cytochrome c subunit